MAKKEVAKEAVVEVPVEAVVEVPVEAVVEVPVEAEPKFKSEKTASGLTIKYN